MKLSIEKIMYKKNSFLLIIIFLSIILIKSENISALDKIQTKEKVENILMSMSLEEKVGQMLMPDFRTFNNNDVTEINTDIKKLINECHLGGIILFKENVKELEQTVKLVDQLQCASPKIPLLISIDQEGGSITRIQFGTNMPGNMALGATQSTEITYNVANAIGKELSALGINVNFAPVIDVNNNQHNPVIGIRSFSSDADLVSKLGISYIKGLQDAAVASTAKHFPGHGDTDIDSHLGLPCISHDIERLKSIEFKPFENAIRNGVDIIMTAHVIFPAIDNTKVVSKKDGSLICLPATLSHKALAGYLRNSMNFEGVIITDALCMKAITEHFGDGEAVIMAIKAGNDILLMPRNIQDAYNTIVAALKTGELTEDRINQSVRRILTLKINREIICEKNKFINLQQKISYARSIVGCDLHKKIEKEAAESCVTLIKNNQNMLPFSIENNKKVVFFVPYESLTSTIENSINELKLLNNISNLSIKTFNYENLFCLTSEHMKAINDSDFTILVTASSNISQITPGKHFMPDFMLSSLDYLKINYKKYTILATKNPYDISYLDNADSYIAVFSNSSSNIFAGIRVIFNEVIPKGSLPIDIRDKNNEKVIYTINHGLKYKK